MCDIEMTKLNNPNNFAKATYDMLNKWLKNREDNNKAWDELAEALRKVEASSLIHEVQET